ncbi:MAG TPA: hypothetical protein VF676_06780 [Flavobacterium sp.]|jgi:hypothetical protein
MKKIFLLMILLAAGSVSAQIKTQMTPGGFPSVKVDRPNKPLEDLIERTKAWAAYFNRNSELGYDVYDVSETGLSIDAGKINAFFYRNRGEVYQHRIRYTLRIDFSDDFYTMTFYVKEIYDGNSLTKLTIADFFAPDGRLKEDYEEVKPSLEHTVNQIMNSYAQYIIID